MSYLQNINKAVIDNNKKAFEYADGTAWDNKKRKTKLSHIPRGKCYKKLADTDWKQHCNLLQHTIESVIAHLERLKIESSK